ncbi:hypothetical protein M2454_003088 [Aequitasia blattaphilus]|uniref:MYND-type domain-containing protein n=1 Tax=Aequitasia blattaphilus TaxID=2949332 RepID=A0ABT1ED37_9FIRM|nr:hypothetical protein [Aequitasia blattaphilus]MCP1103737.1 hypothetical protein [Aequitasia blattaphilus]MCR8616377.1 hypothetical protein [Aequitasia blattaphilus]
MQTKCDICNVSRCICWKCLKNDKCRYAKKEDCNITVECPRHESLLTKMEESGLFEKIGKCLDNN